MRQVVIVLRRRRVSTFLLIFVRGSWSGPLSWRWLFRSFSWLLVVTEFTFDIGWVLYNLSLLLRRSINKSLGSAGDCLHFFLLLSRVKLDDIGGWLFYSCRLFATLNAVLTLSRLSRLLLSLCRVWRLSLEAGSTCRTMRTIFQLSGTAMGHLTWGSLWCNSLLFKLHDSTLEMADFLIQLLDTLIFLLSTGF